MILLQTLTGNYKTFDLNKNITNRFYIVSIFNLKKYFSKTNMKKILPALLVALLVVSCNSSDLLTNDEIDPVLRKSFDVKNDSIAMAVHTNNNGAYYLLSSEDFYAKLSEKTKTLREIYWDPRTKPDVSVMDEFYISQEGIKNHELHSGKNGYTVHFANTQKESYVSVLKIHANEQQHYLLAVIYSLKEGKWKIDKIVPARYSFFGFNANDMYKSAKEKETKGFTVDAFVFANGALNLVMTGGKDLVFDNDSEKEDYRKSLLEKLQDKHGKFPIIIKETNPAWQLMNFDMAYHKNGLYTAVHYGTWTSMDNVPALTAEYENVKKYMTKNFPDLDKNQPYIFYRAFSQIEGLYGRYDIHGFIDEKTKTRALKK